MALATKNGEKISIPHRFKVGDIVVFFKTKTVVEVLDILNEQLASGKVIYPVKYHCKILEFGQMPDHVTNQITIGCGMLDIHGELLTETGQVLYGR
jgi:hypothetical protein